jgi:hypothetical protein
LHTKGEKWSAFWKLRGVGRELEEENVHCVRKKRMLYTHTYEMFRNTEVGRLWVTINEEVARKAIMLCGITTG